MYKQLLGLYWTWRIYKNQLLLNDLQELALECQSYPDLIKDVDKQVNEVMHLISQAELQLSKLNLWMPARLPVKVVS